MPILPQSRQTDLVIQELKGELLIYDLIINKAYCLNPTSAIIYQLCDGKRSVSDISREISKKLKQPATEDLVWLALDELNKNSLLSNSSEIKTKFDGLSRREVIRKVGFASVVALPVISSLIAPPAAAAQTMFGGGPAVPAACPAGSANATGLPSGATTTSNCSGLVGTCATCTAIPGSNCCNASFVQSQCCSNQGAIGTCTVTGSVPDGRPIETCSCKCA